MFEGIAKTNTTNTKRSLNKLWILFEGIAKTNTTNTVFQSLILKRCLRVLLKQIQQTLPCHIRLPIYV